jgi:hypothetical protein
LLSIADCLKQNEAMKQTGNISMTVLLIGELQQIFACKQNRQLKKLVKNGEVYALAVGYESADETTTRQKDD